MEVIARDAKGSVIVVPASEILFIRSEDKYTICHTITGRELFLDESVRSIQKRELPGFMVVKRGALANTRNVIGMEKIPGRQTGNVCYWRLTFPTTDTVDVARRYILSVRRELKKR